MLKDKIKSWKKENFFSRFKAPEKENLAKLSKMTKEKRLRLTKKNVKNELPHRKIFQKLSKLIKK